jgi:hypothetical protein
MELRSISSWSAFARGEGALEAAPEPPVAVPVVARRVQTRR